MKKLILTFLGFGLMLNLATGQSVGVGAYDDFADSDAGTAGYQEYGTAAGGIYWYKDASAPAEYTMTRNETEAFVVNKGTSYTVIGFNFGDSNGNGSGTPFTIDISAQKSFSIKAMATTAVRVDVQVEDINGVKLEIKATDNGDGSKDKLGFTATTTNTVYTIDLTGARVVLNWTCANWPTDCPTINSGVTFDYTKVKQVVFLVSGGTAYTGTLTFDNAKIGCANVVGLNSTCASGTNAAQANVSSSKLYPNPTSDMARVELNLFNPASVKVTLSDLMGKEVMTISEGTTSALAKDFSVANLNKGIYTVNYFINGAAAKSEMLMVK
jgi:hypothetical protein